MEIAGLQKMTLLDYPEHVAATVFLGGCNFRCPFCYNSHLVFGNSQDGTLSENDVLTFLGRRRGLLDGICITGGEPTLQPGLGAFCREIREMGFLVKLDTNGSRPDIVRRLVEDGVLDYVAIDFKNAPRRYAETCGIAHSPYGKVEECIYLLAESKISFELRTTVTRELHGKSELMEMAELVSGRCAWFIQNFQDAPSVLAGQGRLHPWDADELKALSDELKGVCPRMRLRGIE